MKATVFTLSTKAYQAKKVSAAGAALKRMLEQVGFEVKAVSSLPEDKKVVTTFLRQLADTGAVDLIVTTGSTGVLEKDCAPEVTAEVCDRMIPGIPEAIRAYGLRYSKAVILDRSAAGICRKTVIVNLPESPKMAKEGLEYVLPELVQLVEALQA